MCKHYITTTRCRGCGHCVDIDFHDTYCDAYKKSKDCRRKVQHEQKEVDASKCDECKQRRKKRQASG
ncbi:uncharacterized protein BKA55DRAFT_575193 [Fusarium redolens]|uniref:Uncharacterized protein n=1 Tax=Fusarium redolens TaxID=48865 RepID=A0A9P9GRY4_FUSRE|nr:uncharacterized protein BKA55DRAFT_575193 [Fusarium redolens]KAH7243620.1 hypothetical protein BKA55DRAFT_575193 [Fusarium redolens]